MEIRKTRNDELPVVLRLRDEARLIMRAIGNSLQWPEGYPKAETFMKDIEQGHSHLVIDDGQIVGTFAFIPSPDPTYRTIYNGKWTDDTLPYYVIHRIASTPESHGVLAAILDYCFRHTTNIRIDTHRDNAIMRSALARQGFSYCGIIHLDNGEERLAFQKLTSVDCGS